jgi:hypothetical protein
MGISTITTAERLAKQGRGNDTLLAHVAAGEVVLPSDFLDKHPQLGAAITKALEDDGFHLSTRVVGLSGNVNPATGLQEFEDGGDGGDGDGGGDGGGSAAEGGTSAADAAGSDAAANAAESGVSSESPSGIGDSSVSGAGSDLAANAAEAGVIGVSPSGIVEGAGSGTEAAAGTVSGGSSVDFATTLQDDLILQSAMRRQGRYVTYTDRTKEEVARAQEADLAFIKTYDDPLTLAIEEPPDNSDYSFFGSGALYTREQDRKQEADELKERQQSANPFAYAGGTDRLFAEQGYEGGFGTLFGNT